jgi:hypothetical protein
LRGLGLGAAALAGYTSLASVFAQTQAEVSAAGLEDFLDSEIQGYEREIILTILSKLPPWLRDNVVYFSSACRIFVNRVRLRGNSEFLQPLGGPAFRTSTGEQLIMPSDEIDPDADQADPNAVLICETQKGPYRRLRSKKGSITTPYTVVESYVWLPSLVRGEVFVANSLNDTPHIYHGGSPGGGGSDVDAGFLYSAKKNDWALFVNGGSCSPAVSTRFRAGQLIELNLFVLDEGRLTLSARGYFTDGTFGWNSCTFDASGFRKDGIDNRFKRITSIGQRTYDANSGSYLRYVEWNYAKIGLYGGPWHDWADKDTSQNCVYPNTAKVYVDFRTFSHEIVHIDLR